MFYVRLFSKELNNKTRSQGEEPLQFLIKKKGVEAVAFGIRTRALMDSTTVLQPLDRWSIHKELNNDLMRMRGNEHMVYI
jgi:hypothetical protein